MERRRDEIEMEVHREEMSLADMIRNMKERLLQKRKLNLLEMFRTLTSKHELVLSFIATLEIVRTTENIRLAQDETFGDILLTVE